MFCGMPWSVVSYDSIPSIITCPMQYDLIQNCRINSSVRLWVLRDMSRGSNMDQT
jgi:hypothetical protein